MVLSQVDLGWTMEDSPFSDPAVGLVQELEPKMEDIGNEEKVGGGEKENGEKVEDREMSEEQMEELQQDSKPPLGPRAKSANPT